MRRFTGLYAIADADAIAARGLDFVPSAQAMLRGGAAVLQVRAKTQPAGRVLEWLRALRPACAAHGALLFANDRADLAALAGADGVHVGQSDLPVEEVQRCFPQLLVGVSTHDVAQLDGALALRPDYVALGPLFPTGSKLNPEPVVGLAPLERCASACSAAQIPLVAIGGITPLNARRLGELGVMGAAIAALLPPVGAEGAAAGPDTALLIEQRARALARALSCAADA